MIRNPTAPRTHLVFDVMAWSSGLAMSVVLYRWRLCETVASGIARLAVCSPLGRFSPLGQRRQLAVHGAAARQA
jgi:hypothetical protein